MQLQMALLLACPAVVVAITVEVGMVGRIKEYAARKILRGVALAIALGQVKIAENLGQVGRLLGALDQQFDEHAIG